MIISIASGKGGTGKTTVAVNLALSIEDAQLIDCDVEEPNAHLFLKPKIELKYPAYTPVPEIDEEKCNFCGLCQKVCAYNALAVIPGSEPGKKGTVLVFPHLCHGCGGCMLLCPQKAIREARKEIGALEIGLSEKLHFAQGILKIGEVMAPPLIRRVKQFANPNKIVIIDAPPGTSCPVIAAVKGSDYCVLVTEPTPFGLHDLTLAVEVLNKIKIPFGVVINRSDIGDDKTENYCKDNGISVLMRIPFDEDIARLYSRGIPAVKEKPEYRDKFIKLYEEIKSTIKTRENEGMKNQHGHNHIHGNLSGAKYLGVILLNAFITIVEAAGGVMSGSLSLLSDAAHNLGDTVSIMLSYFAWKIARKEKDSRMTYGYKRAEIIAAFVNASALVGISLFLVFEAVKRFRSPETISSNIMIGIAVFGLAANFISMLLLEKESHGNMNVRSSYLHLLGDTISSVGVLLGGIAIHFWNLLWVDPLITLLIAAYIMRESWGIVKHSVGILMQSSANLDYSAIQRDIEAIPEVRNIHHVHTWMANENTVYFEAHIDVCDCLLSNACGVSNKIEDLLKERYGISHTTLQFETGRCPEKEFFKKR